jgi:asparagine synthase (glutamine-hydrolysing)
LLSPAALRAAGLLKAKPIAEKWAEHQSGARNWQHFLWNVLMFQAWHAADQSAESSDKLPSPEFQSVSSG